MDIPDIREAVTILKEYDLSEITIKDEGISLSIRRDLVQDESAQLRESALLAVSEEDQPMADESNVTTVTAPIVGVVRLTDRHGNSLAERGSSVVKGQILCVIEAMKIRHEVRSVVNGSIKEIIVADGGPVEYGQKIMTLSQEAEHASGG